MTYRHPNWEQHINAISGAFPLGTEFNTFDAGNVLMRDFGIDNPGTAVSYASYALRYQLEVNEDCPEATQLIHTGKRGKYHWEPAPHDPAEDPIGSEDAIEAFDADH